MADPIVLLPEDAIRLLQGQNERLRAALSFYGDHLSYGQARFEGPIPDVIKDGGRLARRVLSGAQEG